MMRLFALLLVLVALCHPAYGGPTPEEAAAAGRARLEESEQSSTTTPPKTKSALPPSPTDLAMLDPQTKQTYLTSMQHFYQYRTNGYAFRSRVFEWQLFSSRVIFVIVVLLVLAGIYFAAIQFHVALTVAKRNAVAPVKAPIEGVPASMAQTPDPSLSLATQLEISAKGIVVNSSVLGVLILALSLAFFYLYLVYVYPINDTL